MNFDIETLAKKAHAKIYPQYTWEEGNDQYREQACNMIKLLLEILEPDLEKMLLDEYERGNYDGRH